jgi:hypothetical protein
LASANLHNDASNHPVARPGRLPGIFRQSDPVQKWAPMHLWTLYIYLFISFTYLFHIFTHLYIFLVSHSKPSNLGILGDHQWANGTWISWAKIRTSPSLTSAFPSHPLGHSMARLRASLLGLFGPATNAESSRIHCTKAHAKIWYNYKVINI